MREKEERDRNVEAISKQERGREKRRAKGKMCST